MSEGKTKKKENELTTFEEKIAIEVKKYRYVLYFLFAIIIYISTLVFIYYGFLK